MDLINIFGRLGGFDKLKKRICDPTKDQEMNLILLCLLVKPWGNCAEYLTQTCLNRDMLPVVEMVSAVECCYFKKKLLKSCKSKFNLFRKPCDYSGL